MMLGTRYIAIPKRISTLKSFKPSILGGTTIITLRYNSTKPSTTTTNSSANSSRLKPSSFAFRRLQLLNNHHLQLLQPMIL